MKGKCFCSFFSLNIFIWLAKDYNPPKKIFLKGVLMSFDCEISMRKLTNHNGKNLEEINCWIYSTFYKTWHLFGFEFVKYFILVKSHWMVWTLEQGYRADISQAPQVIIWKSQQEILDEILNRLPAYPKDPSFLHGLMLIFFWKFVLVFLLYPHLLYLTCFPYW